jgi:hypothetical protein
MQDVGAVVGRPDQRRMRNRISNRGWWGGALCGLFGIVLSGTALAASSTSATAAAASTQASASTAPSKHPSAPAVHKTTTHSSSAHKTSHKSSTGKGSSHASAQKTSTSRGKRNSKSSRSSRKRGQQVIDRDRTRAIQEALIREHYLQDQPSGSWDSATQAAMQRYQADQGWQSKTTPDSRALIKLGLGPSKDHLLNPESAMTSAPAGGDPKNSKSDPADNNPQK